MRRSSRLLGLFALLTALTQHTLAADTGVRTSDLVDQLRALVSGVSDRLAPHHAAQTRIRPQAIAQGGAPVDLSNLSNPTQIEARLRSALDADKGPLRINVPGGTARQGDFSLGSSEELRGHLLVVDGNADIYGTLRGNLVTMNGNVTVHPGSLVSGDILTLGGQVSDQGGEIGGEVRTLQPVRSRAVSVEPAVALSPFQSVLRRAAGVLGVFLTLCAL